MLALFNKIVLIGRLTRDPELRYTSTGKAVANFTLAVDRIFKREGEPEADFFRVTVWNKQAENCANYLAKGSMAAVDGRVEMNKYTDKDGQERMGVDVTAGDVRFLSSPGERKRDPSGTKDVPAGDSDASGGDDQFTEDDLPF